MSDSYEFRFPHCDPRILHPTGECEFCDASGLHQIREAWGICCTGVVERGKTPCPADVARTKESQNHWSGNRAYKNGPGAVCSTCDGLRVVDPGYHGIPGAPCPDCT